MNELATKSDIQDLKQAILALGERFDRLEERLFQFYKNMLWTLVALTAIFSAVVAVIR